MAVLAGTASILLSGNARADAQPPVSLTWEGPDSCDRAGRVFTRLRELLVDDDPRPAPVVARIKVETTARGYAVLMTTEQLGVVGTRRFEGATCDKVTDAIAVVLAVLLAGQEPVEASEAIEPPQARTPEPAQEPVRARVPTPPREERARPPSRSRALIRPGIRGGVGSGAVPGLSAFIGLAASLSAWGVDGTLSIAGWLPRTQSGGPHADSGVSVGLWVLAGAVCLPLYRRAVSFELCVAGEVGVGNAAGQHIRNPRRTYAPWVAAVPGFVVRVRQFPGLLGLDIPVGLVRHAYTIDGYGQIYAASPVGIRVFVGVEFGAF